MKRNSQNRKLTIGINNRKKKKEEESRTLDFRGGIDKEEKNLIAKKTFRIKTNRIRSKPKKTETKL